MLFVYIDDSAPEGLAVALNGAWMPTWAGFNLNLLEEISTKVLVPVVQQGFPTEGEESAKALLDLHNKVIDYLCDHHPREGLRAYLKAVEGVAP
jgi:hypothetical protein